MSLRRHQTFSPAAAAARSNASNRLLGLAGTIYRIHFPPGPVADEAAYVMITQSLWHDHDLAYDHRGRASTPHPLTLGTCARMAS